MRKLSAILFIILLISVLPFSLAEENAAALPDSNVFSRFLGREVDAGSIAVPESMEYNLAMFCFPGAEIYWEDSPVESVTSQLYVAFRVESAIPEALPVYLEQEHADRIDYNGQTITLEQLRGEKNLVSCIIRSGDNWSWYDYTDQGLYIIVCFTNPDAKKLREGTEISFSYEGENLQTGEKETGRIRIVLPPLSMYENFP